jgi:hypothetical protein
MSDKKFAKQCLQNLAALPMSMNPSVRQLFLASHSDFAAMEPASHPVADHIEQQAFLRNLGYNASDNLGPRRRFAREVSFIEYDPWNKGWYQGGTRMPSKFRPRHYWTRPCDGKRTGTWGRFKDAITGEGPDVFVTTSGDRRTLMRDRPQKWQWSGWPIDRARNLDPDFRQQDAMPAWNASWTNTSSRMGAQYNFKTRRYETPRMFWQNGVGGPNNPVWRDAQWKPNAKRSAQIPYNCQTPDQQWWTTVPRWAGQFAGGRPRV